MKKAEIIQIIGKKKWPISIIIVGLHGDEKCGVNAMQKILPCLKLKIEDGRVLFVYGNPKAIRVNKRFIEADLNRMFTKDALLSESEGTSYEYKRAQLLKEWLKWAGALLDIHASFTLNSKPFAICEANAKGIVEYLPVDLVVSGFDQVVPGGADYYMNSIGKIGICFECGFLGDNRSMKIAEKSIFAFLKARGHIANNLKQRKQTRLKVYDLYKTKTNNFILTKPFADFEEVLKGQVIGRDGGQEIKAPKNSFVLFASNRKKVGEEAFLLGNKII